MGRGRGPRGRRGCAVVRGTALGPARSVRSSGGHRRRGEPGGSRWPGRGTRPGAGGPGGPRALPGRWASLGAHDASCASGTRTPCRRPGHPGFSKGADRTQRAGWHGRGTRADAEGTGDLRARLGRWASLGAHDASCASASGRRLDVRATPGSSEGADRTQRAGWPGRGTRPDADGTRGSRARLRPGANPGEHEPSWACGTQAPFRRPSHPGSPGGAERTQRARWPGRGMSPGAEGPEGSGARLGRGATLGSLGR
jgi:hypothetical protein